MPAQAPRQHDEATGITDGEVSPGKKTHVAATTRPRRLLNHYDASFFHYRPSLLSPGEFAEVVLDFTSWQEFAFDTVMWDVDGGMASYPSRVVPHYPGLKKWLDAGNDFLPHVVAGSRERGLEVFLSFRMNAGQDPNFDQATDRYGREDWLIDFNEDPDEPPRRYLERLDGEISMQKWDYSLSAVRARQVSALVELATYDVDGIQLDFARGAPYLRVGQQWLLRDHLTRFMRDLRAAMTERARKRGQPVLLAARVAESIEGCHFDGIDIETWVCEDLVDLLIPGCRSFDVDIQAFARATAGTPVRVYPCHDNHHSSDGYKCTPLRVLRGIASNWWNQGADGIAVFNFVCTDGKAVEEAGLLPKPISPVHRQDWDGNRTFLSEAGEPERLAGKSKTYAVQRRGGGAPWEFGYPEDGITVTHAFQNANPLASLPARLGQHGTGATYLRLEVGEPEKRLACMKATMRLLVSDEAGNEDANDRIASGLIRRNPYVLGDGLWTSPLRRETAVELEVRINNVRLAFAGVEEGWLTYPVVAAQLATGANLLTVRLAEDSEISIEKIELDLDPD